MLLAVGVMSPTVQAVFFGIAVVCFLLSAIAVVVHPRIQLLALGLASFAFVFFWGALAAAK